MRMYDVTVRAIVEMTYTVEAENKDDAKGEAQATAQQGELPASIDAVDDVKVLNVKRADD